MTIQGAIYELNNILSSNDIPCYWKPVIKKIIETVEQNVREMSEQTDGDLIPRQAVITMLNKIENAVEDGDGFQFNEWIEYAKDIPSAEKTAEWKPLDKEKAQYYMFGYVCSKCGAPAKSPTKYCSNCGAKICMEEIKDET